MSTDPTPAQTFAPGARVLLPGDRRGVVIGPADGCAAGILAVEVEVPASTATILTASDYLTADLLGQLEASIAQATAARRARYEVTACSRRPSESDPERVETAARVLHSRRHRAGYSHCCDACRGDARAVAAALTATEENAR